MKLLNKELEAAAASEDKNKKLQLVSLHSPVDNLQPCVFRFSSTEYSVVCQSVLVGTVVGRSLNVQNYLTCNFLSDLHFSTPVSWR